MAGNMREAKPICHHNWQQSSGLNKEKTRVSVCLCLCVYCDCFYILACMSVLGERERERLSKTDLGIDRHLCVKVCDNTLHRVVVF